MRHQASTLLNIGISRQVGLIYTEHGASISAVVNTVVAPGKPHEPVIHYATVYPVTRTPCGVVGPSASEWRYVTCRGCLTRRAGIEAKILGPKR